MLRYERLPENLQESMKLYIERGVLPGGFLQAALSNNLKETFEAAGPPKDMTVPDYVFAVVNWLYNEAPAACWGTEENMIWFSRSRRLPSVREDNTPPEESERPL